MVAQQTEDSVEEADGMPSLPWSSTCCVAANVGPLYLGEDSVERFGGGIGPAREVLVFQSQEIVGEAGKVRDINEETAYDEDGLVVWQGRIAKCSEIPIRDRLTDSS